MPSPVGHTLGGLALTVLLLLPLRQAARSFAGWLWDHKVLLAGGFILANAHDLDYLAGIGGNLNHAHHWYTHTIGWTFLLSIAGFIILRRKTELPPARCFAACLLIATSHILLDLLSRDFSEPRGIMLAWPFSSEFLYSHEHTLFLNLQKSTVADLFTVHNLRALILEAVLMLPFLIMALYMRGRRRPEKESPTSG